jgi:O-antigen ligase
MLATGGFLFAVLKRPEIGIIGILLINSSFINDANLPRIPIGIGRLMLTDIVLIALFGLIIIRRLTEQDLRSNSTPLDIPIGAFFGIAIFSTMIAINNSSLTIDSSLGEVRTVASYLTFFLVTNLVREERQLRLLLKSVFILAAIVALFMTAQYVLGPSTRILPGRIETLSTEGVQAGGVTRIIPPGESLIYVTFVTITVSRILDESNRKNMFELLLWGLTGIGVLLIFKRHIWASTGAAILLLALLGHARIRPRMMGYFLVIALLAAIALLCFHSTPNSKAAVLVNGAVERLVSLVRVQTYEDSRSSLRWRDFEYEYALPQVASHPLLGLGLGASYRPSVPGKDWTEYDGRRFLHNGHLHILVKSGFIGYLCFLCLSMISLHRGFKYWSQIADPQSQAVLLGFTLAFLGILIGSVVSPMIMNSYWTPVIGMMLGTNEVIIKGFSREEPVYYQCDSGMRRYVE